jgi:hypothetical protein
MTYANNPTQSIKLRQMNTGHHFFVLLSRIGLEELGKAIDPYLAYGPIGQHIKARDVNPSGALFHLTLDVQGDDGKPTEVEIQLPHAFIKMVISGDRDIQPGFTS